MSKRDKAVSGFENIFKEPVDGRTDKEEGKDGELQKQFQEPPFSVLDARGKRWQKRKALWGSIGIESELGRGEVQASFAAARRLQKQGQQAAPGRSPLPSMSYSKDQARGDSKGRAINCHPRAGKDAKGAAEAYGDTPVESWVVSSIFDPVLCEICYRWWSPKGGMVLDPFAGGSVRGIVAGALGRDYWGCDLRAEQIEANIAQLEKPSITRRVVGDVQWVAGDSRDRLADAPMADFILSCPPYGDLEIYSDDPNDISGMEWKDFAKAYKEIIAKACAKLKPNRFAAWVVGDFRDKEGHCRNFVGGTIRAFKQAGLELYNEAVLVTSIGSATVRARRQFNAGRKMVKTHQNVLIFVKGDWKEASAGLPRVEGPEDAL